MNSMVGNGKTLLKMGFKSIDGMEEESQDMNHNEVIGPPSATGSGTSEDLGMAAIRSIEDPLNMEENFNCRPCNQVFPDVVSLDQHCLAMHPEKILECNFCGAAFLLQDLNSLRQHILRYHYRGPKCSLCGGMFTSRDALKNHVRQRHLNETSTCDVCQVECQDLPIHMDTFHKKKPATLRGAGAKRTCPDCLKEISVDNFGRHVKEKHSKLKKSCPHCSEEFGPSNLRRHIRQVHDEEKAKCPECDKVLFPGNLSKHIKEVHMKVRTVCKLCNTEMPLSRISIHRRAVHNLGRPIDLVIPRKKRKMQRKQLEESSSSRLLGEQAPEQMESKENEMKWEEFRGGDSTHQVEPQVKEESLPVQGEGDHQDVNGNKFR